VILVDTSIWVDHLRTGDTHLVELLELSEVLTHSMILGELALGSIQRREAMLDSLTSLPGCVEAHPDEVRHLTESRRLHGKGIGLVDAHLLASALLTPGTRLWTRDRRLGLVARELDLHREAG